MILTLKLRLLKYLHDHRRAGLSRRIGSLARTVHRAFEHPGYDPATNGEAGVLRTLPGQKLRTVLDIGANHGEWTRLVRAHHPEAFVHLFEIAPPTFAALRDGMKDVRNIQLHPFGVGSTPGPISLHYYPGRDALTSAAWHMHEGKAEVITGEVKRGDLWAAAAGLQNIDFLKIDVEGMELDVLRSFGDWITGGRIAFIQFEHHGGRNMMHDFYELLVPAGYRIGKIYSRYVDFRDYDMSMEDGIGPNYFAARTDRPEVIAALNRGWSSS